MKTKRLILSAMIAGSALMLPHLEAGAQDNSTKSTPHSRVDPQLFVFRHALETQGLDSPLFGEKSSQLDPNYAGVSLRFDHSCGADDIEALGAIGGVFARFDEAGEPFGVGHVYRAMVPWQALEQLYTLEGLIFAESLWSPTRIAPLEVTGPQIGAKQANQLPGLGYTGKGTLIVDVDSGIDVLHPALFRADGDSFAWVDQDQDGKFTGAGQDFIDFNDDGNLTPDEALKLLDAIEINRYTGQQPSGNDGILQASKDWVYLDLNQNGKRDTGGAGFTESTPAYGEPIFVVDDVNKDDLLDPKERLVQLKTSKVRKVVAGQQSWVRGTDLILSATDNMLQSASHGTGVVGIIVGGYADYHQRHGLAPDADIILSSYANRQQGGAANDHALTGLEEAVIADADMVLHEWTNPFSKPHDGSTNVEAAMDSAFMGGIAQVNPVGNLNYAQKHIERPMVPNQAIGLGFNVGPGLNQGGGQVIPFSVAYSTLQWKGSQLPTIKITDPEENTATLDLNLVQNQMLIGTRYIQFSRLSTTRGNTAVTLFIYGQNQNVSLPQGTWKVDIEGITEESTLIGRISDYYSSWGRGIGWTQPTLDFGSIVYPSTADSAFGVAAFGGRHLSQSDGTKPGELRGYSGRGPRMDNQRVVDITAPDDPFAPLAITKDLEQRGITRNWYSTFGGTSGAGPHVAAAIALLLEQDPTREPQQLYDLVTTNADAPGPIYETNFWGAGKLNVYQALYQQPIPPANRPPVADLTHKVDAAIPDAPMLILDATASTDPEQDALEARFDFNHDGTYDTPWSASLVASTEAKDLIPQSTYLARVEVRDALGNRHGKILEFTFDTPAPMEPELPDMGMPEQDMYMPPKMEDMSLAPDMFVPEQDMYMPPKMEDMGKGVVPQEEMGVTNKPDQGVVFQPVTPLSKNPGAQQQGGDEGCGCGQTNSPNIPSPLVLVLGALLFGLRRRARASR